MPVPDVVASTFARQVAAPLPNATPVPLPDLSATAAVADPGMDGKVAILNEMMPPEWGGALSAFQAASSGAGSLGAVMAALPSQAQTAAGVMTPLLSGNLAGSLSALAGRFLPPELQPVFAALQQVGGLSSALGVKLPKLPSPFTKPKPPEPGSADLGTDPGSECGVQPNAARISDLRACPKGAGPIISGQMNVLIGFMPAARIGDKGLCVGPPDVIIDGESTVLIGGSPASRLADKTMHGGTIKTGYQTVLIGKSHAPCAKAAAAKRAAFVINGPGPE